MDRDPKPLMCEAEAVGNRAHLHGHRMAVDAALPDRIARHPWRDQLMRKPKHAVGAGETHRDEVIFPRDVEPDFVTVQPHRAATLALYGAAGQLAGNLPLAFAEHVIDRSRDRSQPACDLAFRDPNREPLRELLGNKAGRKIALAPARMKHQRRQERNVMADTVDVE